MKLKDDKRRLIIKGKEGKDYPLKCIFMYLTYVLYTYLFIYACTDFSGSFFRIKNISIEL